MNDNIERLGLGNKIIAFLSLEISFWEQTVNPKDSIMSLMVKMSFLYNWQGRMD